MAVKSAFADVKMDVNLVGSAPCVVKNIAVLVDSRLYTQNETINTWINWTVHGNVSTNDTVPPGTVYSVSKSVDHGALSFVKDGTFTYKPKRNYKGVDNFIYQACELSPNGEVCSQSTVTLNVGTQKLAQHVLTLTATPDATVPNGSVRLLARGGNVKRSSRFSAVAKDGAKCFISGSGNSRRMQLRGSVGASCTVTASNSGNKIFDSVTSNTVIVNIR
jgi:hypothetical protein